MKYIFWRISPSPHMDPLFTELARRESVDMVRVVFFDEVRSERKELGWNDDVLKKDVVCFRPNEKEIQKLINEENSFHIFSGVIYHPVVRSVFYQAIKSGRSPFILCEGRDFSGVKGALRYIHSWWIEARFKNKIAGIFAIGDLAVRTYEMLGFCSDKICKFTYLIDVDKKYKKIDAQENSTLVRFIVVSRLVEFKRVDLIIEALKELKDKGWFLEIVGDGPQRERLEALVLEYELVESVRFIGRVPNDEVLNLISKSDCLIFASNFDGWGVVVNESLMLGTPVIVSRYPGASDLIQSELNGYIFETDDKGSLILQLKKVLAKGKISKEDRSSLIDWSNRIQCPEVCEYFIRFTEGGQVLRPWAR